MRNRKQKANKSCDHLNGKAMNNIGYMTIWW